MLCLLIPNSWMWTWFSDALLRSSPLAILEPALSSDFWSPSCVAQAQNWVQPWIPKQLRPGFHTRYNHLWLHTHTRLTGQPYLFAPTSQEVSNRWPSPALGRAGSHRPLLSIQRRQDMRGGGPSSEVWLPSPRGSSFTNLSFNSCSVFSLWPQT